MKEIKPLTSLRGIFAFWVLFFHLGSWSPMPGFDHIPIMSRGYLGVDFFFILSGFILATADSAPFVKGYSVCAHSQFAIKRIARIFPLHLTVLIACLVGDLIFTVPINWWAYIVGEALLIHRWNVWYASGTPINVPDWSISTEWAANLLFPCFIWALLKGGVARTGIFIFCAAGTLLYVGANHGWNVDIGSAHSFLPLLRCCAEFGIGILVFRFQDKFKFLSSDLAIFILILFGLAALFIQLTDLLEIAIMIGLVGGFATNNGSLNKIVSFSVFHFLGKISYSIYLIQIPVIILVRKFACLFPNNIEIIYLLGSIISVILLAWPASLYIESWGKKMGYKILDSAK